MKNKEINTQETPIVRAALNEHWNNMIANSTYVFSDLHRLHDDSSYIMTDDPIILEYTDPKLAIIFPATRFLRVNTMAGRVVSIRLVPQLESSNLKEAFVLLESLKEKIKHAAWQVKSIDHLFYTYEEFKQEARQATAENFQYTQGYWEFESTELIIEIKRLSKADMNTTIKEDQYIVTIRIEDDMLMRTLYKKVKDKRQELYGNIYERVPLEYWLKNG